MRGRSLHEVVAANGLDKCPNWPGMNLPEAADQETTYFLKDGNLRLSFAGDPAILTKAEFWPSQQTPEQRLADVHRGWAKWVEAHTTTRPVAAPTATQPAAPAAANDTVARVKAILPAGWSILRTVDDTYPSYRPEGKGKAIFLVSREHRTVKQDHEAVVHIMPPDYDDGGPDPTHGQAQTYPARLISSTPQAKIYLWGSNDRWPTMADDLVAALTK